MALRRSFRGFAVAVASLALVLSSAVLTTASGVTPATAPANDNFANAKSISTLPFNKVVDVTSATLEGSEPTTCGLSGNSVWYKYHAAANVSLGLDTRGSNFTAVITIWDGASLATLSGDGCGAQENGKAADLILEANSGTTYYIQVGVYEGNADGRSLHFNVVHLSAPSNDVQAHARTVGSLPWTGAVQDIRGATYVGEPNSPCRYQVHTLWYRYTAAKTQTVRVDNLLGDFFTTISVYHGAGLTLDDCGSGSNVAFHAVKGTTYFIQVGADSYEFGNVHLRVRAATSPANDSFAHPKSIGALPATLSGKTSAATVQHGEPQDCAGYVGSSVWYRFTPTKTGNYRFVDNGSFAETTAIYSGTSLGSLVKIACGDPVVAHLIKNHTYRIAVAGENGENGSFSIQITRGSAPANDDIASATVVSVPGSFSDTEVTTYATNQPGEAVPTCQNLPAGSLWYKFTAGFTGTVRVQTIGSDFDTVIAAYTGATAASLTQVGCDDDSRLPEPDYLQSSIAFNVVSGNHYWIQAGGYSSYTGTLKVQIQNVTPPANDNFTNAITVSNGYSASGIDTSRATVQSGEPDSQCSSSTSVNGATLWYKFHATSTNQLTFTASTTSSFTPNIGVFSGTNINSLTAVGCNGGTVSWTPVNGTDYRIQVSGSAGGIGLVDVGFSAP